MRMLSRWRIFTLAAQDACALSFLIMVTGPVTKEQFSPAITGEACKVLKEDGLFTFITAKDAGTMAPIVQPLCIAKEPMDEGLASAK